MDSSLTHQPPLSIEEDGELEALEAVIDRGRKSFLEVAGALVRIREGKLYRKTHTTFEAYCRERWDFSRDTAYDLMAAASVVGTLSGIPNKPSNVGQALELLPLEDEPGATHEVWGLVVAESQATGAPITAAKIKSAVRDYLGAAPLPTPRTAQTEADKTGKAVAASDGMYYPPTSNTDQTWITILHWAEAIESRGLSTGETIRLPSPYARKRLNTALEMLLEYLEGIRESIEEPVA